MPTSDQFDNSTRNLVATALQLTQDAFASGSVRRAVEAQLVQRLIERIQRLERDKILLELRLDDAVQGERYVA